MGEVLMFLTFMKPGNLTEPTGVRNNLRSDIGAVIPGKKGVRKSGQTKSVI